MRKSIALLLACIMMLSLAACSADQSEPSPTGGQTPESIISSVASETEEMSVPTEETETERNAIPLTIGDKIDTDSFCMTFDSLEVLPEFSYRTSDYSSTSLYVEDGYQLALLRGHFENKSMSAIKDSNFAFTFTINDAFIKDGYDVKLNFMRSKYFEIDPYTDYDYCIYINIPQKLAEEYEKAVVTVAFNDDLSLLTTVWNSNGTKTVEADNLYEISTDSASDANTDSQAEQKSDDGRYTKLSIGDKISTDSYDFRLNNVELTYEVKPSNTSSVYTSYTADSGKIYVHIDGNYYNSSKRDACIRDLPVATVYYDDGYTYNGFAIVDRDDNSFFWVSSYVICTPLETCHYHCLVECPEIVGSSAAPLYFTIAFGDTLYRYDIR